MGARCRVSIRPCNPHPNGSLGEARDGKEATMSQVANARSPNKKPSDATSQLNTVFGIGRISA